MENFKREMESKKEPNGNSKGESGWGKTCKLKAISFQCMTKFTTN